MLFGFFIGRFEPETRTVDYDSLLNKRVNEIDELYISPKSREYCRESARELHEQTAKFIVHPTGERN